MNHRKRYWYINIRRLGFIIQLFTRDQIINALTVLGHGTAVNNEQSLSRILSYQRPQTHKNITIQTRKVISWFIALIYPVDSFVTVSFIYSLIYHDLFSKRSIWIYIQITLNRNS